jgi:hypothetical protein
MAKRGKADGEQKPAAKAKAAKLQADAEAADALEAADQKQKDQRLLAPTRGKPSASAAQKAMHAAYKQLDRFSSDKDALLQKFLKDKKCGWYQGLEQVKSESNAVVNNGLRGYGTRFNYKVLVFFDLQGKGFVCYRHNACTI